MRLIGTLKNPNFTKIFSSYLERIGIGHRIESHLISDWGSDDYGTAIYQVWVINEDQTTQAIEELEAFTEDPYNPKYAKIEVAPVEIAAKPTAAPRAKAAGRLTVYLTALCVFIFLWGSMTRPPMTKINRQLPLVPLTTPSIYKPLFFDYPKAYDEIDRVAELYDLNALPVEGQYLLKKALDIPTWDGIYPLVVNWLQGKTIEQKAPLFEKISQGQLWRLFSPALLHSDIFHILFNMLWLFVLGKQMEVRLKIPKYLLFILITGIFSNATQYLMSGPNFIGFSGVLCAMITFVRTRQMRAPWEGYDLHPNTFVLISVFVLAMAGIGLVAFALEVSANTRISIFIANTAHLSGALSGWLLGRTELFQSQD